MKPNPRLSLVLRGAEMAHNEGCDVVIGTAAPRQPTRALPIVTVPTLAATGSETNNSAVIADEKTTVKSFVKADRLYPRVALIDPALTASLPPNQTAFGVCDLLTQVTEGYFNGVDGTPLQDRLAEGAFLHSIGCPTHLSELHIGEAMLPRYAHDTVRIVHDAEDRLSGSPPMREAEIVEALVPSR